MKNFKIYIFLLSTIVFLTSCTTRIIEFTLLSTKDVPLSKSANFKKGKGVFAEDVLQMILSFPTAPDFPTLPDPKEVVDMAIESVPGCVALADGSVTYKYLLFGVYNKFSFVIEGTAIIDPNLALNAADRPKYTKVEIDKDGNRHLQALSCDEYQKLKNKIAKGSRKTKLPTHVMASK